MVMKLKIPDDGHYILGVYHVVDKHRFNEDDADESGAAGLYKSDGREIHIDTSQPEHTWLEVFIHETIHGIDDMCDLGLKHYQICVLSLGICDVLKQMVAV